MKKQEVIPTHEYGIYYSESVEFYSRPDYRKFDYFWKYMDDEGELHSGIKTIYILGSVLDLLKLINHWNRMSDNFVYWTDEI